MYIIIVIDKSLSLKDKHVIFIFSFIYLHTLDVITILLTEL